MDTTNFSFRWNTEVIQDVRKSDMEQLHIDEVGTRVGIQA